ncbi:MAG: 3-methyl-2-oxobutanoate hydroxymethyltransferase, partial [Burkholderiaceae bacterium]
VKLEGGEWLLPTVQMLVQRGIPVCAHLGLIPQSVHQFGGFKVQAREDDAAQRLLADALALQAAGASLLVLEAIPAKLATEVTNQLNIPTIGIGAGLDCSGQVLVMHDMLGAFPGRRPKFMRDFMQGQGSVSAAIRAYVDAVKQRAFPAAEHSF